MIYIPRIKTDRTVNPREEKPVRLASLPFDIPPATHDETAPRSMPVKAKALPTHEKHWLGWIAMTK